MLPFCFICLYVSHLVSDFVMRRLGGSFAKLSYSEGLCGFANVPPIALAYSAVVNCLPANVPYAFPDTSPRL